MVIKRIGTPGFVIFVIISLPDHN